MRSIMLIAILLIPSYAIGIEKADSVLVIKSESRLYLIKDGKTLNEYHVVFGANPKGHKQKAGDERTPEGRYILDYKKRDSDFYKSIHISYPNEQDKQRLSLATRIWPFYNMKMEFKLADNGGTRLGIAKRKFHYITHVPKKRSGIERRKGFDRRSLIARGIGADFRDSLNHRGSYPIERRDAFRANPK